MTVGPERYRATKLWLNVSVLLKELDIPYKVNDVKTFWYDGEDGPNGSINITVFSKDARGQKTGTVTYSRWIGLDQKFSDWDNPLEEPVVS